MLTLTLSISLLCFPEDKTVIEETDVTEAKSVYLNISIKLDGGSYLGAIYDKMIFDTSFSYTYNNANVNYVSNLKGAGFNLTASVGSNEKDWNWGSLSVGSSNKTTSASKTLTDCPYTLNNTKCKVVYSISNSSYYSVNVTINGSSISSGNFLNSGQNGNKDSTFNIVATITPKSTAINLYTKHGDQSISSAFSQISDNYGKAVDLSSMVGDGVGGLGYEFEGIYKYINSQLGDKLSANGLQVLVDEIYGGKGGFVFVFKPITYSIQYYDGSSLNQTKSYTYDTSYTFPSITKTGYTFLGWSKTSGASSATYAPGAALKNLTSTSETLKLYAVWQKLPYKVDINILSPSGNQDYKSGTMSQTYNGTKQTGLTDQYYSNLYINETFTISDIVPATGYVLSSVTCTNGKITNNGNGSYTFTASFTSNPSGSWDAVIEIKMSLGTYTLTVDPNGGTWSGSTNTQTFTQNYLTTKSIAVPTREGYDFAGWVIDGAYGTLSSVGKVKSNYGDQFFKTGSNGTGVYNNSSNGMVTHTYLSTPYDDVSLTSGARILKIRNTGSASPGLGGFTNWLPTSANAVFYTFIYSKIPVGYTLETAYNAHGDNSSRKWLTPNAGTGEWEIYVYRWQCGSTGSFSSINYFYLNGMAGTSSNPVDWYVAYFGTFDATGLSISENIAATTTFTYGAGNTKLIALWTKKDITVSINANGGKFEGNTTATKIAQYRDLISLPVPTRDGYTFKGWNVTSGNAFISNTQYCYEEKSFDGYDDFVALGRDKMYTNKITIAFKAYMDNWAEYASSSMRLISCTEGGGWNFESNNGNIVFACYDSGNGYKSVTTDKAWSSLSAGWHAFAASFDGTKVILYIDGKMIECSAVYTSKKIGYNSTNGIFVGAEAGVSSSLPINSYFNGVIKSIVILNEFSYGTEITDHADSYIILGSTNVSLNAIWEETWAMSYQKPAVGDGSIENPYQVSKPEELAYFAYKTQVLGEVCSDNVILTADIDLAGKEWTPIGTVRKVNGVNQAAYMNATFDGQGHKIKNININVNGRAPYGEYGLFGSVDANGAIKNLTIESGQINGLDTTGGIVGFSWRGSFINLKNHANISGQSNVGGILGIAYKNVNIQNCENYGIITGINSIGGILGRTDDSTETKILMGVVNAGHVSGWSKVGGIAGEVYSTNIEGAYTTIKSKTETATRYSGGIVGYALVNTVVTNAVNTAEVQGRTCVGGLLGGVSTGGSLTNSYSENKITIVGNAVDENGFLIGGASTSMVIADCFFIGTSNIAIGKFYGNKYKPASINSCYSIINNEKVKTAGSFENWTIYTYLNEGRPIQVALLHIAKGDAKPDEVLNYFTKNSFTQT